MPEKQFSGITGIPAIGGGAVNTLHRLISGVKPWPDVKCVATNTEQRQLEQVFGKETSSEIQPWYTNQQLSRHVIGQEVTNGRGSGKNPDVGRAAMESASTKKFFLDFFEGVDSALPFGCLGGGSASGGMPVVIDWATHISKGSYMLPTVATVTLPLESEGIKKELRALEALAKIQAKVPTIVIRNQAVKDFLKDANGLIFPDGRIIAREDVSYGDIWEYVTQVSISPVLTILREITGKPGDIMDLDHSDWTTATSRMGRAVTCSHWKKLNDNKLDSKAIIETLLKPPLQDGRFLERPEILLAVFHGVKSDMLIDEVLEGVKEPSTKAGLKKVEDFRKISLNVSDDDVWIGLMAFSKSDAEIEAEIKAAANPEATAKGVIDIRPSKGIAAGGTSMPAGSSLVLVNGNHAPKEQVEGVPLVEVTYLGVSGLFVTKLVPANLKADFYAASDARPSETHDLKACQEDFRQVGEKVVRYGSTKTESPRLPLHLQDKPEPPVVLALAPPPAPQSWWPIRRKKENMVVQVRSNTE